MLKAFVVTIALVLGISSAHAQTKIVIDAGHGGTDPGGTGTGMEEKNVVLDVCQRFKALLEADSADNAGGGTWTALMTRNTDVYVSLTARSAYSNNNDADRFMSIHSNAFGDTSANGTETFSYAEGGNGSALRNLVQAEMLSAWGLTNRGSKTANYAVLRDTAAPAILHELAFITNGTDAAKLASAAERQKAALAHLRALQKHYSIVPYEPGAPSQPQTDAGDIAGKVVDASGPIVGAKVALDGGATVVTDSAGMFAISDAPVGGRMLTASAAGHASKTVAVTVAASAQADVTIELSIDATGSNTEPGPDAVGDATGGCSTSGGAGLVLALGMLGLVRRRRRA